MSICKKENTKRKTEIKIKERETEKESERKKSEIPWRRARGSTERRTPNTDLRSPFSDLWFMMKGDQANDNDDNELAAATTWLFVGKWFIGFDFGLCIGDFFFFLINTSVLCVWFAEFCVWFAFVLGFDLSASDDATWCQAPATWWVDWIQFLTLYFFFFLVENGLAVSELPIMGSPWAWLAMDGLGFVIYVFFFSYFSSNFFWVFFFFFAWK